MIVEYLTQTGEWVRPCACNVTVYNHPEPGVCEGVTTPPIDALETCNVCDVAITTPNPFGYCPEHLAELQEANR